eukprot:gene7813-8010_t
MANLAGSDGGSGWGLVATQDMTTPGTRLIELPRRCQLTYDESTDPRVLGLIQQVPDELWGAKLALQVLVQRVAGAQSPFATYISQLPVGVSGVPMFFPREALEALEYPPVVEQVKKRARWLNRFSIDMLSKLPGTAADPFDGVTVDINSMGWALAVVTSRAFRVAGPSAPAALLPLIDMANHSFAPNCEVVPVPGGVAMVAKCQEAEALTAALAFWETMCRIAFDAQQFVVISVIGLQKIKAGEPLLLSYGQLSNDFLLMDYGFAVPGNPNDRVALRFDLDLVNAAALTGGARDVNGKLLQLSSAARWKQEHLRKLGLAAGNKQNLQVLLGGPNLVEPRLLAAVRGLLATYQSEVENLTLEVLGSWDRPLNKQNEAAAIRILIGMAMLALLFRSQRKQLLVDVISSLADKLKQVPRFAGLKEGPIVAAKKGQKPKPATGKGFGAQ